MTRSPEDAPSPGDLFLDEALPECERVTLVRNGWRAAATHVWVGAGWARLVPGPVALVPDHAPRRRPQAGAPGAVLAAPGATVGAVRQGPGTPRIPRIPEPTPGPLPGPSPHSALDLELSEAEPRRLVRSARQR